MGSGSSVQRKNFEGSREDDGGEKVTEKQLEDCDSQEILGFDFDNSLFDLSKQELIIKIREMQSRFFPDANNSNKNFSKSNLIPRSIFSEFETTGSDLIRTKDILICQLESELRTQKMSLENQKLQMKQKLAAYASEITDLRFKTNKRIYELELDLKKQNNSTRLLEHDNPLIMKLSHKINEQDLIIKEMESSLARKDEIIEGFKIFEACQYNRKFDTSEENQQNNTEFDFNFEKVSRNTRSFISKDLVIIDSFNKPVELSLSDEKFYCTEHLNPTKYLSSKATASSQLDSILGMTSLNTFPNNPQTITHTKSLVKLPTDIIGSSSSRNE